ncbi:MAG: M20/M25/M40 family metallo-hydrolase [Bacteroidia bacterium]|nr:M20/M25/M40 family metallo-hydrolase [Bacteroidia bacterium]
MKKILFSVLTLSILTISLNYGQVSPVEKGLQAITPDAIKAQFGFLASDWTEGRMAGEKGEFLSADYIASMLQLYGVKPGGDLLQTRSQGKNINSSEISYFQNFVLLKTNAGDEQILKVKSSDGKMVKTTNFTYNVDFTVKPSDPGIEIEAPVVFAGYGFISSKLKYNDFSKIDVKGKFILRISGIPKFIKETLNTTETESLAREMESTLKAMGAIGIIEFNPQATVVGNPDSREFVNLSPSEGTPRSGKPYASFSIPGKKSADNLIRIGVSVKTANEILKGTGVNFDDYIKKTDANEPFLIPPVTDKSIYFKTTIKTTQVAVRNVIGIIEGTNPEQVIVLGAHYDHLGIGNGYIWNGADDNGSGTVGVMTLAKAIMETGKKPEKTIIFALWTAEEEGLLGSRYWVQNPTCPLKNIRLNVNFDMISRYFSDDEPKKVTMTYTSSCPGFKDMTIANLKKYDIDLIVDYQPSADPTGGTDHRSFVNAGIPIMRFKPGHREEYHTPKDELNTIDWDIMEKIIRINFSNVWELANTNW